jgi:hypothetical protein
VTHFVHEVCPLPKPRMTQRDVWKKRPCVVKYRAYCDRLRELGVTVLPGDWIWFILPQPKSRGKRAKLQHQASAHMVKPDLDNLLKGLIDAVVENDQELHSLGPIRKVWACADQEPGQIWIWRPDAS